MTNSLHASKKLGVIPRVGRIRAQKKKKKQTDRQTKKKQKENGSFYVFLLKASWC